jgi:hypothetical protein
MMKKLFFFGMMGAMALTFAACSSEDEVAVNPTYDGNAVKTDFAFNITKAAQTRMDATITQEAGNTFRGMQDMYLLAFSAGKTTADAITGTSVATTNYPLGTLANTEITTDHSKKIYALTIPVGTDNFLFYGKALRASETLAQRGNVSTTLTKDTKNAADVKFNLEKIAETLGDDATKIADYLTAVAGATGWAGTVTTAQTDGNYKALAQLYTNFTTVKTGESRAGSAEGVVRTILDLYKSAKAINGNSSVEGVKTIAGAIVTAINTAVNGVKVTVTDTATDPANWTAVATGFEATFPANLGLPMGSAMLTCTSGTFAYADPYYAAGGTTTTPLEATVSIANIDYPSELIYFDNSPLLASNVYKVDANFPATVALWDQEVGGTGFDSDWTKNAKVAATTRAVAMQNNVNYGVALLESTVKLQENTLLDNQIALVPGAEVDQQIDGTKFKVTGILIGGQPAQVGWDMTDPTSSFANVIYDSEITFKATALQTTESAKNWTVVFDNYTSDTNGQKDVLVALQILNGDKDFYGKYNVIPAGSTFYLVGKLALPTDAWTPADRKNGGNNVYRVTKEDVKRVFIQDYKTVANFTLTSDALKEAYSTIPDLMSTQTIFGLSVDLKWETGLTFDVEI